MNSLKTSILAVAMTATFQTSGALASEQYSSYSMLRLLTRDPLFNDKYLADKESEVLWRSEIANDAMGSGGVTSDQYFTNGLQFEAIYQLSEPFLYDEFRLYDFDCAYKSMELCPQQPQSDGDLRLVDYGIKLVHNMYTPYEEAGEGLVPVSGYEHIENAEYYDRPYAAWAYVARTLKLRSAQGYSHHELSLGIVGPSAFGREGQEWAHQYPFTGPDPIDGWETQVDNRLAIQYGLTLGRDLLSRSLLFTNATFGGFVRGNLGTIKNEIGAGLEFSWSWPKREAELPFSPQGFDGVVGPSSQRLQIYSSRFSDYLQDSPYLPPSTRERIVTLVADIEALERRADEDPTAPGLLAAGLSLEEAAQDLVTYINEDMADSFVRRYRHQESLYVEFNLLAGVDYVISNYLIEGDINVPAGANPDSDNQIMRDGGKIGVTLNPYLYRFEAGVDVGYKDVFSVGYRYYLRGEETKEQKVPHSYSALNFSAKTDYGWAIIPVLLAIASANNYDNWPESQ
ncbi:MAG: lipid A-modifier LpxR family protein [Oceanobacter sp.]